MNAVQPREWSRLFTAYFACQSGFTFPQRFSMEKNGGNADWPTAIQHVLDTRILVRLRNEAALAFVERDFWRPLVGQIACPPIVHS